MDIEVGDDEFWGHVAAKPMPGQLALREVNLEPYFYVFRGQNYVMKVFKGAEWEKEADNLAVFYNSRSRDGKPEFWVKKVLVDRDGFPVQSARVPEGQQEMRLPEREKWVCYYGPDATQLGVRSFETKEEAEAYLGIMRENGWPNPIALPKYFDREGWPVEIQKEAAKVGADGPRWMQQGQYYVMPKAGPNKGRWCFVSQDDNHEIWDAMDDKTMRYQNRMNRWPIVEWKELPPDAQQKIADQPLIPGRWHEDGQEQMRLAADYFHGWLEKNHGDKEWRDPRAEQPEDLPPCPDCGGDLTPYSWYYPAWMCKNCGAEFTEKTLPNSGSQLRLTKRGRPMSDPNNPWDVTEDFNWMGEPQNTERSWSIEEWPNRGWHIEITDMPGGWGPFPSYEAAHDYAMKTNLGNPKLFNPRNTVPGTMKGFRGY